MDEREAINAWRELFRGREASADTLAAAEALLNRFSGESPLRLRLANELEELKKGRRTKRKRE